MQTFAPKQAQRQGVMLQPRLAVNAPGDTYEQEAERVAQRVMGIPGPQLPYTCNAGCECTQTSKRPDPRKPSRLRRTRLGITSSSGRGVLRRRVLMGKSYSRTSLRTSFSSGAFKRGLMSLSSVRTKPAKSMNKTKRA